MSLKEDYQLLEKIQGGKPGTMNINPAKKLKSGYKMPKGEQGHRRPPGYKKPKGMSGRY